MLQCLRILTSINSEILVDKNSYVQSAFYKTIVEQGPGKCFFGIKILIAY